MCVCVLIALGYVVLGYVIVLLYENCIQEKKYI